MAANKNTGSSTTGTVTPTKTTTEQAEVQGFGGQTEWDIISKYALGDPTGHGLARSSDQDSAFNSSVLGSALAGYAGADSMLSDAEAFVRSAQGVLSGATQYIDKAGGMVEDTLGTLSRSEAGVARANEELDAASRANRAFLLGQIPADVAAAVRKAASENSITRGLGVGSSARALSARDLGTQSTALMAQGIQSAVSIANARNTNAQSMASIANARGDVMGRVGQLAELTGNIAGQTASLADKTNSIVSQRASIAGAMNSIYQFSKNYDKTIADLENTIRQGNMSAVEAEQKRVETNINANLKLLGLVAELVNAQWTSATNLSINGTSAKDELASFQDYIDSFLILAGGQNKSEESKS